MYLFFFSPFIVYSTDILHYCSRVGFACEKALLFVVCKMVIHVDRRNEIKYL